MNGRAELDEEPFRVGTVSGHMCSMSVPPLSLHAWLRHDAVSRLLRDVDAASVLEIGCGQGSLGVLLARRFRYTGVDLDEQALAVARSRFAVAQLDPDGLSHGGLELVAGRSFDLVCAFEVLEHFENDAATLAEWREHVRPGGWLLVSVPAGPERFAAADRKAGHFRRYDRSGMVSLLEATGFRDVGILNYGFPTGYALEAARNRFAARELSRAGERSMEERTRASGRWLQPPDGAATAMRLCAAPLRWLQRPAMSRDTGTGLVALARLG
jgi:SAM-dependent methyltransferase